MEDLREQLIEAAETAIDNVHDMDVTHHDYAVSVADAILELLKGAVKPLEWSERNDPNEICIAADCSWGRYKIVDLGEYGIGVYTPRSGPAMVYSENVESAKAAAQADYSARTLAAMGVK